MSKPTIKTARLNTLRKSYLGWDRPLVQSAAEQLLGRYREGQHWNLGHVVIVVPTGQGVDRLFLQLKQMARENRLTYHAPAIITVGQLPELLYQPRMPLASDLQSLLAWTQSLIHTPADQLAPLLSNVPARDQVTVWFELAHTLHELCENLASDNISPAEVSREVQAKKEQVRWQCIDALHANYLSTLAELGLSDVQEERRIALLESRCRTNNHVYLVGCVDVGTRTCQMFEKLPEHVELWIGAPADHAQLFDSWGRVAISPWQEFHIEIGDDQWCVTGNADQQVSQAVELVKRWQLPCIGVTDSAFAPIVETELLLHGLSSYRLTGIPFSSTSPSRLLKLIHSMVVDWSWASFAALCRHPSVLSAFGVGFANSVILQQLDAYRANHFPVRFAPLLPIAQKNVTSFSALATVRERVENWLSGFHQPANTLAFWAEQLRVVLLQVFDNLEQEPAPLHKQAAKELLRQLEHFAVVASDVDWVLAAPVALEMLGDWLEGHFALNEQTPEAIPISGWLDLAMDDSPSLVVLGFNHPYVPQSVTVDPFLPGNLRSRLKVADNDRRFARDAYILQLLLRSHRNVKLIVGTHGADGAPTPPSRLFSTCPSEVTVHRIDRWLTEAKRETQTTFVWSTPRERTTLEIPRPMAGTRIDTVSVTAFRDYMACPFRFYLRHVVGLRPLDDATNELAANQFGDLVHAAVEAFGFSDDRHLQNEQKINAALQHHLSQYALKLYGEKPATAVQLQIAQASKRLEVVAGHQSQRRQQGWEIAFVEKAVGPDQPHPPMIVVDADRQLYLKGRIDRIDYHPTTDSWAILDYKTHGHLPLAKHYQASTETWIDLQLPLYLSMLAALDIAAPLENVSVGYFNIAQKASETGVHLAEFSPQMLESAFACARQVAAAILSGRFDPLDDQEPVPFDDYAAIMQVGIAQNLLE